MADSSTKTTQYADCINPGCWLVSWYLPGTRTETAVAQDLATASDKNSPADTFLNLNSETTVGTDSTAVTVAKKTFNVA
jgi:hypothetical protein